MPEPDEIEALRRHREITAFITNTQIMVREAITKIELELVDHANERTEIEGFLRGRGVPLDTPVPDPVVVED